MKTPLLSLLLFVAQAAAQNVSIGTKNTTLKDAGVATFAGSTFCLKDSADSDKACINAPVLAGNIVITIPAVTSTLATLDGTETLTNKTINGSQLVANSVALGKIATISTANILGRTSGSTGDVESLTATQATALLNAVVGDSGSGGTKGLVPAPASGDAAANKYLKASGAWATVSGAAAGGSDTQVQYNSSGSLAGNANLAWVNSDIALNIGGATSSANSMVNAQKSLDGSIALSITNTNSGSSAMSGFAATDNGGNSVRLRKSSSTNSFGGITNASALTDSNESLVIGSLGSGKSVMFVIGGTASGNEVARFTSSGFTFGTKAAPTDYFEVKQSNNGRVAMSLNNGTNGTGAYAAYSLFIGGTGLASFSQTGSSFTPSGIYLASQTNVDASGAGGLNLLSTNGSGKIIFGVGGSGSGNEIARFTTASLQFSDAINIAAGTTTGTKIGTATSQKFAFWNATPIVQPTTAVAAATFSAGSGSGVLDGSTFDGYTIGQVVKALRNAGLLQ